MKVLKNRFHIEHDFFTYKGLRTIYAQVCSQVFNGNDPDNTLYLARILGHGRGELLRGDKLIDMPDFSRHLEKGIFRVSQPLISTLLIVNNFRFLTISLWKTPRFLVV